MSRMCVERNVPVVSCSMLSAIKMMAGLALVTSAACDEGSSRLGEAADVERADSRTALVALRVAAEQDVSSTDRVASSIRYLKDQTPSAAADGWLPISARNGVGGEAHVRVNQAHAGVPVFGGDVIVRFRGGKIVGATGNILARFDGIDTSPGLTAEAARRLAKQRYLSQVTDRAATLSYEREHTELVILPGDSARPAALAWHVTFSTELQGGMPPGRWNSFHDANSGALLWEFNGIDTLSQASGPGGNAKIARVWQNALDVEPWGTLFEMSTSSLVTTNMNHRTTGAGTVVRGPLDPFGDEPINDAHGFAEATLDMLRDWQGYDSIDDAGFVISSRVHYGVQYENAFWNGSVMTYGDGASRFYPMSGALDVVAHEIHHGFTSFHSSLVYSRQSGGMNESFSDIAGEVADAYFKNEAPDFLVGSEVYRTGVALRFMCDPKADGVSIDHFSNYNDSMDVHHTSGIMNKAFCLSARRLASGSPDGMATRASVQRASRAWYLANANYWTSSSTFVQGCQGVVDAAEVLGMTQDEVAAIGKSWRDVGVTCRYPLAWMTGDVNGDGRADLIEPMENGLGMVDVRVSLSSGSAYSGLSTSANLGQTISSLAWLTGEVNGDGRTDIIQTFDSGGRLGVRVYASSGAGYYLLSSNSNTGQGSAALAWLTGDVNGDGRTDLIQPYDNGGRLGVIVYGSNGAGFTQLSAVANTGQGASALAWLTGDVNGDGRTDLIQPYDNGGRLGLVVHRSNGTGFTVSSAVANVGQGSGALKWLTGDVNGDGRVDLIQPFDNGGRLGMLIYGGGETGFTVLSGSVDVGQGSGALAWLSGDVNADGRTDLVQLFNNQGGLGLIMYRSDGSRMVPAYGAPNLGQGSVALSWLMGDANGDGRVDVIQPWANENLGLILYASSGVSFVNTFGTANIGPLN